MGRETPFLPIWRRFAVGLHPAHYNRSVRELEIYPDCTRSMPLTAGIFDLGKVVIDWDQRHLYRDLIPDPAARERFLAEVLTDESRARVDAGEPIAESVARLCARHPDAADLIRAYYDRFDRTMRGPMPGMAALLGDLTARGVPLYALSNWSAETFLPARARFAGLLDLFGDIVISGDVKLVKPDPRIFHLALARWNLRADEAVFIDDMPHNVAAAEALGITAIRFTGADDLRPRLRALGLL